MAELEAEVRQLEAEVRKLARLAHTDALTGLPNRRALDLALARELARTRRLAQPLCLAIIDLDHFKAINDTRGHQTGDQLLKQATAAWNRQLRAEDMLARNEGDEFTAILVTCELEAAAKLIERLRAATPHGQTCSAGVASWDGKGAARSPHRARRPGALRRKTRRTQPSHHRLPSGFAGLGSPNWAGSLTGP